MLSEGLLTGRPGLHPVQWGGDHHLLLTRLCTASASAQSPARSIPLCRQLGGVVTQLVVGGQTALDGHALDLP